MTSDPRRGPSFLVLVGPTGLGKEPRCVRMGDLSLESLLTVMLRSLSKLFCMSHLMAPVPALPASREAGPASETLEARARSQAWWVTC